MHTRWRINMIMSSLMWCMLDSRERKNTQTHPPGLFFLHFEKKNKKRKAKTWRDNTTRMYRKQTLVATMMGLSRRALRVDAKHGHNCLIISWRKGEGKMADRLYRTSSCIAARQVQLFKFVADGLWWCVCVYIWWCVWWWWVSGLNKRQPAEMEHEKWKYK